MLHMFGSHYISVVFISIPLQPQKGTPMMANLSTNQIFNVIRKAVYSVDMTEV